MKVPSQISSNPVVRGLVAVALAWALAAGGAAPAAAIAEGAPAPAAPIVSADTSATAPVVSAEASATAPSPSATATPVAAAAPVKKKKVSAKKLSVRGQIVAVGKSKGLSNAEVSALLWIAKHESNFHPTSKSSSGCYGLFQLSSSIVRGHPWQNPSWNTKRAIKYMKGRYHGVLKAKGFWLSHHWY